MHDTDLMCEIARLAKNAADGTAGRRFWDTANKVLGYVPDTERDKLRQLLIDQTADWIDDVLDAAISITHAVDKALYRHARCSD